MLVVPEIQLARPQKGLQRQEVEQRLPPLQDEAFAVVRGKRRGVACPQYRHYFITSINSRELLKLFERSSAWAVSYLLEGRGCLSAQLDA